MRYIELGLPDDAIRVSVLALGTDYFGTTVNENDAMRLMDAYTEAEGNCIDTARVYASWLPGGEGASERTIGRWLKARGNRNGLVISTKGGHPRLESMNEGRLSRKELEQDLDESLMTLGVDHIDIYWLHRDDTSRPAEDIAETLSMFIKKGKVRAVGCSNWKAARVEEALKAAQANGFPAFCASQIQWSLAATTPEAYGDLTLVCMNDEEYGWYEKNRFPVFAYSSQAKGFFARGASQGLGALSRKANDRYAVPENIERLERVKRYAVENGITPTAAALGYITCNRVPGIAIIGCKNGEQLADSLTASDVDLPTADVEWLFRGN
jgi:aryl-alcohol dehydrogenase-like predicted oxidoreductase